MAIHFSSIIKAAAKARCNTTSLPFLYDAKADLPPDLRQQLLDLYLDRLADFIALEREAFMHHYYAYVYVRIMQALGAYGFRGFYERKAHFLQSVPYALKNVRWLLQQRRAPDRAAHADGRVHEHGGLGEIAEPAPRLHCQDTAEI